LQLAETRDRVPATTVLGRVLPGFVLDIDATIVLCHSEKESAAATWKHTFGFHPLLCFLDGTGEALTGLLRAGNAGSNTAADHSTVLDQARQQIPESHRYGNPILIRSDSASSSHALLAHIRGLREQGLDTQFSVGVAIGAPVRAAITDATDWVAALNGDAEETALPAPARRREDQPDRPDHDPAHRRWPALDRPTHRRVPPARPTT
jgi:hypothetical protein